MGTTYKSPCEPIPLNPELRWTTIPKIKFYYPGYPERKELLNLWALPGTGISYDIAYYAYYIVAGNIWVQDGESSGENGENSEKPYFADSPDHSSLSIRYLVETMLKGQVA
ncbi:hypothetical protein F4821DRAFT_7709 [Hypoxylon rubiginosum]|uniref:Uncharacterized protein n=1 Tax=Hypoxylon rubiginosum TaxID=110542 RepID=A0ACC0DMC3_9PEZI|nr:hypothetical protein F4821DRAFT_7709 [Hypoxylon rubiginosum]